MNDTTPKRSPRTTYAKLRDEANIKHDRPHRWELKPRDKHTKSEKQRLANAAWNAAFLIALASQTTSSAKA